MCAKSLHTLGPSKQRAWPLSSALCEKVRMKIHRFIPISTLAVLGVFVPQLAVASDPTGLIYAYALFALVPFMFLGPLFALVAYELVPDSSEKQVIKFAIFVGFIIGYIVSFLIIFLII